jgi:hypothetical protein
LYAHIFSNNVIWLFYNAASTDAGIQHCMGDGRVIRVVGGETKSAKVICPCQGLKWVPPKCKSELYYYCCANLISYA